MLQYEEEQRSGKPWVPLLGPLVIGTGLSKSTASLQCDCKEDCVINQEIFGRFWRTKSKIKVSRKDWNAISALLLNPPISCTQACSVFSCPQNSVKPSQLPLLITWL